MHPGDMFDTIVDRRELQKKNVVRQQWRNQEQGIWGLQSPPRNFFYYM